MNAIEAIFLGLLQGLTEFLPVSSSGHLAIFQNLFNIGQGSEDLFLFDILLHLGTLIAIFAAFYKDIFRMILEGFGIVGDTAGNLIRIIQKKKTKKVIRTGYRKFVLMVIISTIPTGIIGVLLKNIVKAASATLIMPGIFLIMTAAMLFIADRSPEGSRTPRDASYLSAFLIGIGQGIATLPGISRSGTTMSAGILCGYEKKFALRYSFIMSIPAVMGACVLEISDAKGQSFNPLYLLGMLVAAVVGYGAIKLMLNIVKNKKYVIFSIYCFIMGIVAIVGSFIKK